MSLRISIDAMTQQGAHIAVKAARLSHERNPDVTHILVGNPEELSSLLGTNCPPNIQLHPADDVIGMELSSSKDMLRMSESSVAKAIKLVKAGQADACVSGGNTIGLVAWANRELGKVDRSFALPLATFLPVLGKDPSKRKEFVLLDVGATKAYDGHQLLQYAKYGVRLCGKKQPLVGLLNIGEEDYKGPEAYQVAHRLLAHTFGDLFVGNVESDKLFAGVADIIVTDAFTGNVALKEAEGMLKLIKEEIYMGARQAPVHGALFKKLGIAKKILGPFQEKVQPEKHGGAVILNINGEVVKAHGASDERAFLGAINFSIKLARGNFWERMGLV